MKYKLIKEYPGSPPLTNKRYNIITLESDNYYHNNSVMYPVVIHSDSIGKYSEYWEEVIEKNPLKLEVGKTYKLQYKHCKSPIRACKITRITTDGYPWMECTDFKGIVSPNCYDLIEEIIEKDYEIISIMCSSVIHYKQSNGNYRSASGASTISDKCIDEYPIHSIKRLSDGKIFTIGDKVNGDNATGDINGIVLCKKHRSKDNYKSNVMIHTTHINSIWLDEIRHKKPLFTTEDGVDVFKGDKTCWINNWTITNFVDWMRENNNNELHFSTKKAAEEYVLINKPCLSIKDVMSVAYNPVESYTSSTRKLKKLVKSKM